MLKRTFDILLSISLLVLFSPLMLLIALLIWITDRGPAFYSSERVGRGCVNFMMPKFRTMKVGTPQVATHLLDDAGSRLTSYGAFLRKTSLDELPQLLTILKGDMSFVGPRPALFNQHDLVKLREEAGVNSLVPGLTGWAQINGRDEISLVKKVELDKEYLEKRTISLDIKIMFLTFSKVLKSDDVAH